MYKKTQKKLNKNEDHFIKIIYQQAQFLEW